jgi:Uma2 family endonuclease
VAVLTRKRLLTNEEYHHILGAGILAEEERVELIYGEILEISPIGNRHAACLRRLLRVLTPALGPDLMLDVQNPIHLPKEKSEPQPDLILLRSREDGYAVRPLAAEDILLLIEIADRSLAFDRDVKVPLYARSGIPEVWLVDLAGGSIAVHRSPGENGYLDVQSLGPGETLAPAGLPGTRLSVGAILG